MPLTNVSQIKRFSEMSGCAIPQAMQDAMARYAEDPEGAERYGVEYASEQCRELLAAGVPGIHFYTLNKSPTTMAICRNLGLKSR